jgi:CDP-diacylglycerol--glycerol-3-phosphate 3-phosphatidyltransferase
MQNVFKEFNIADWFSFYRILALPFLVMLLALGLREWFALFLLISYSTDAIDGFLARKLKLTSARGSQLDSIGDQFTLLAGLGGLLVFETEFIRANLLIIIFAFIPYLVQLAMAFKKYGKATAFHTYLAKVSAILQATFIVWALFFEPVYWLFYFMIALGILETLEEISLITIHDEWVSDVKSILSLPKKSTNPKSGDPTNLI